MPAHDRLVIISGGLVGGSVSFLLLLGVVVCKLLCRLSVRLDGDIDMADFKVHAWDEIDTSDLGDQS